MSTAHEICEGARHVPCNCGAAPGADCACGHGAVHLARIVAARRDDQLTGEDVSTAIRLASPTPGAILLDPEVTAA